MDANVPLKEIFEKFNFIVVDNKNHSFFTAWYSLKSIKTGRVLTIEEIKINTPKHCESEIKNNNFRFVRKY